MRSTAAIASTPEPPLGQVLEFMRLIWALDHALHATSKRMERTMGITGPQRLVVRMVGLFPGISAGRLAELLHLHPSTLTGILARLCERGLITRKPDRSDARRAVLALTAAGKAFQTERPGTIEAAVRSTLRATSPSTVELTANLLTSLAATLNSAGKPKALPRPVRPSRSRR